MQLKLIIFISIVTKVKKKKKKIIGEMIQKLHQSFILIMTLRVEKTNGNKKESKKRKTKIPDKIVRVITDKYK